MIRAFRESPVTFLLCLSWIGVFALMAYQQGGLRNDAILSSTARGYGYLTVRDVMAGQVWRTLTATFIHFNLLHLGVNLFGLFQLGRVLESWYGSGPFLLVYVVIGVAGNAIAVGLKLLLSSWYPTVAAFRDMPSGGGSSVLCGLIALLAVVGWRSRTRLGSVVKAEMIGVLAFTALLGVLIPIIDNFGHLGGAVAGAIVGFSHKFLLRVYERPRLCQALGSLAAVGLLAAASLQVRVERSEAGADEARRPSRAELERRIAIRITALHGIRSLTDLYAQVASRHPQFRDAWSVGLEAAPIEPRASQLVAALRRNLANLDALSARSPILRSASCYPRLRELSIKVPDSPPTPNEISEFVRCVRQLSNRLERALQADLLALGRLQASPRKAAPGRTEARRRVGLSPPGRSPEALRGDAQGDRRAPATR